MERNCVSIAQGMDFVAERVPLSGAAGGSYVSDITIRIKGIIRRFECKWRGDGFKELYKWLNGNDGVIVKADREPTLIVLRYVDWLALVRERSMETCKNGHPYTEKTLVWAKPKGNGKPYKKCRVCAREAWHRHKNRALDYPGDIDNTLLEAAAYYFFRAAGYCDAARWAPSQEARLERIADMRRQLANALEALPEDAA